MFPALNSPDTLVSGSFVDFQRNTVRLLVSPMHTYESWAIECSYILPIQLGSSVRWLSLSYGNHARVQVIAVFNLISEYACVQEGNLPSRWCQMP